MRWRFTPVVVLFSCALISTQVACAVEQFKVSDFGAVPDGKSDAGPGIRLAINTAASCGKPAEVVFQEGKYRIASLNDARFCIGLNSFKNLRLCGVPNKTEIVVADPKFLLMSVMGCTNVWIKDIAFDYDPVPFTQGTIVAVDQAAGTFDMDVEQGYAMLNDPWFGEAKPDAPRLGHTIDAKERRLKPGVGDHVLIAGWAPVSNRVFRITLTEGYKSGISGLAVGDRFVIVLRSCSGTIEFNNNQNCGMENVTLYAGAGLAIAVLGNETPVEFRHCAIRFKPDTTRLITTNGDGFHCGGNRKGPIVEDGYFEGMPDDTMNVYCTPVSILDKRSPTELLVNGGSGIRPDDMLQIYDPNYGIRAEVKAVKIEDVAEGSWVTLESAVESVVTKKDNEKADSIFNLSACGEGFIFRNNTVGSHRRHGVLVRAPNGLIEGNTFDNISGNGVFVSNEPGWPEGPIPRGTTIRNNRFISCGNSAGYEGRAIQVLALKSNNFAQGRPVTNITIKGNQFINQSGPAIFLAAAKGVSIRNNDIRSGDNVFRNPGPDIELHDSERVVISDNTIDDPRKNTTAAIVVQANVEPGRNGLRVGNLNAKLAPESKRIDDKRPKK